MARWGEDVIARVKERSDIVDVLSGCLSLSRAGANYKALCPFHQEKTPSFMVSPARQMYHCFGCGTGGDVIHFLMKYEGLPFIEAVRKLAGKAGINLPEDGEDEGKDARAPLYRANRLAAEFYGQTLMREVEGKRARDYLASRGIHSDVCRAFGVGYAPPGWHSLEEALAGKGVDTGILAAAGLSIPGEGGKGPHDRFRDRVVFPIRDLAGRVLGFGGRVLDESLPKYVNSPETAVYRKGDFLFGLDQAAPAIRAAGEVLLTEGYLDVIALHQEGLAHTVGVLGTALTAEQAARLRRITPRCVLLFDADAAGVKAALRSGLMLLEEGLECRVAPLDPGEDPDSFIRKKGKEALLERIAKGPSLVSFALETARQVHPGDRVADRVKVLDAIIPFLVRIKNRVELALYLEEAARALGVRVEDVREELAGRRRREKPPAVPAAGSGTPKPEQAEKVPEEEKKLLLIMMREPALVSQVREALSPSDFSGPETAEMAGRLFSGQDLSSFLSGREGLSNQMSQWAVKIPIPENVGKELLDCVHLMRIRRLKDRKRSLTRQLSELEAVKGDRRKMEALASEIHQLDLNIHALKRADTSGTGEGTAGGEKEA